ncbi:hypothetical protein MYX75_13610, partial [Acidobacteria bacterium AH-259-A15]|nr:hypothetical protein [Acidobacteria bacterium AH-259-A15]
MTTSRRHLGTELAELLGGKSQDSVASSRTSNGGRLDSWKEIAAYLQRDVSTVMRWEKKEALPVHRHMHDKRGTVYAYRSEIDTWLANRRPDLGDSKPNWRRAIPWSIAVVIALIAGVAIGSLTRWAPQPLTKFVITPPATAALARHPSSDLAISPDGKRIVYVAESEGSTQLYVRPLNEFVARPIPGTESTAASPFFSPDGESVGFFADGKLKNVSLKGELPRTVCYAPSRWGGGSWDSDTIVFSAGSKGGREGLYRVSAAGGEPESLIVPDLEKGELGYTAPKILPGGEAVLFDVRGEDSGPQIRVLSLKTGEQKITVDEGTNAYYAATGHLVYQLGETLMAVPFDLARLGVTGESVPILEEVRGIDYALSGGGTLVYVPRVVELDERSLVWVDRQGTEHFVIEEKGRYSAPRISPDGRRVAFTIFEGGPKHHVWIYDLEGHSLRRLTFEGEGNSAPIWTPDGKWITFKSNRDGIFNLYRGLADGSGSVERLTTSQFVQTPYSWFPDGSVLAFDEYYPGSGDGDIWLLPRDADAKPQPLISSPNDEGYPRFSPDGRWLAYASKETGRLHVYLCPYPYPEPDVKWLVSGKEGGFSPVWAPHGTELFYRSLGGGKMMAVRIQTEPTFRVDKPRVLFEGAYLAFYDI